MVMTVVPAPLAFLKVEEELFPADGSEFEEAMFGEAPKGFDAIDVILTSGEFVGMVMNPVMLITIGHQAIVGLPSVGINIALGKNVALEDRQQLLP
jgi:hypothetical protein